VIGAACARAAALRGLAVAVFEPGPDVAAASPASAGMLAAQIEPAGEDALSLSLRARDLYDALAPTLLDATGIDVGLWRSGIASLAFDEASEHRLKTSVAAQRQAGLRCDWLGAGEVAERWEGMAPECRGALFAPEDGALDPQALTRALLADARRLGAVLVMERVTGVTTEGGRATGVISATEAVASEHVVVAAGAWSPGLSGLPRPLTVEPVRGQLAATAWPDRHARAILYYDHCYVLARGEEAVLGSTMEHAGFECRVTNEGLAQIFRSAVRLMPALEPQPVLRMWAGLRPVTPDGAPFVGQDPDVSSLWYATGHGRNGVLLAALTGEVIGDLVSTGSTTVDVTPWRPGRHDGGKRRPSRRSARTDPQQASNDGSDQPPG